MTLRLCLTPLLVVAIISTTIFATPLPQQETSAAIEYTLDVSPLCDICKEWELVNSVKIEEKLSVLKYRSKRTGLTVILGPFETPIVNSYFCLATEAFDDDGLPHTLEHLIFRGSEEYPYKETLDNLANR